MQAGKLHEIATGPAYAMDIHFAREFAILTLRPETEALSVLRTLVSAREQEYSGRNKHERAMRSACESIITWYENANDYALTDLIGFIASHQHACVYAVLVGRTASTEVSA